MRTIRMALFAAAVPVVAAAQSGWLQVQGDSSGDALGFAVTSGLDLDGDGWPDFAVGAPFDAGSGTNAGEVRLLSGRDGAVLLVVSGDADFEYCGWDVAFVGDLDGDGADDLAIASPGANRVRVFSGRTGALLLTLLGDAANPVGQVVASAGDVDADGKPDLALGIPSGDGGAPDSGTVRVHSGRTGGLLLDILGGATNSYFGWSVAAASDVDADGHDDLLAGAQFEAGTGSASLVSGFDGHVLHKYFGTGANDRFGFSVSGAGDLDGDGTPDAWVGAPIADGAGGVVDAGIVRAFSGATGAILLDLKGGNSAGAFGQGIAGGSDLDGDGRPDCIVGEPFGPGSLGESMAGRAHVHSGANGAELASFVGDHIAQTLGGAVALCGDVTGDGRADFIFQSESTAIPGAGVGTVAVATLAAIPRLGALSTYGGGCGADGNHIPHLQFTGRPTAASAMALSLTNVPAGGFAMVFAGSQSAALRVTQSCSLLVVPVVAIAIPSLSGFQPSSGYFALRFKVPAGLAGILRAQAFVALPSAPSAMAASNGAVATIE